MADKIDNKKQAYAKAKSIRTSGQKLNLVAKSIRGCNIKVAIDQLTFSKKRISREVLKVLNSAIANAENNFGLDIDKLVVSEAYVGKSIVMKRMRARARGRAARILKPFSKLTILLKEIEEGK
ncbi:MAG: 50S ribosomal protein L22 [Alphaproteobacteria bacterium]|nr:MAG: 50S ribosomal protein L22 [Alphaproteobacteria bacterium]